MAISWYKTAAIVFLGAAVLSPAFASAAMTPEQRATCIAAKRSAHVTKMEQLQSLRGVFTQIMYAKYSGRISDSASITPEAARRAEIDAAKAAYRADLDDVLDWYKDEIYIAESNYRAAVATCK